MACKELIPDPHAIVEHNGNHYRLIDLDFPEQSFKPDSEWDTTECAARIMAEKLKKIGAFRINKVKCRQCSIRGSIIMTRLD